MSDWFPPYKPEPTTSSSSTPELSNRALFLAFDGRATRGDFLVGHLWLLLAAGLGTAAFDPLTRVLPLAGRLLMGAALVGLFVLMVNLAAKRLRDIGYRGELAVAVYAMPLLADLYTLLLGDAFEPLGPAFAIGRLVFIGTLVMVPSVD